MFYYTPLFSAQKANKLIEKCLAEIETNSPDMTALLLTLSDLTLLVRTANYDNHVLNNLIAENKVLSEELDAIKLAQISDQVSAIDKKLEKIERDFLDLQSEVDFELEQETKSIQHCAIKNLKYLSKAATAA